MCPEPEPGCSLGRSWFLLENRRPDLGDEDRKRKRYVTVNEADGSVSVAEKTGATNQRWNWLSCSGKNFLINCATSLRLTYDGSSKVMASLAGSEWSYDSQGFLREVSSGKVATVTKRYTHLKIAENIGYIKDDEGNLTDEPWSMFLWNIINVD